MGLCQISRSEADIWGFLPPKQKNCHNCQLIRLARVNPCLMLVKSVGFMWVIGLQKLLTFGAIQLVN